MVQVYLTAEQKKNALQVTGHVYLVPRGGLEPPRLAAPDFESGTSTNSITEAGVRSEKTLQQMN